MKQKRNIIFFFYLVCGGSLFQMQPLSCASAKDPEKPQSLYVVDIANQEIDSSLDGDLILTKYMNNESLTTEEETTYINSLASSIQKHATQVKYFCLEQKISLQ